MLMVVVRSAGSIDSPAEASVDDGVDDPPHAESARTLAVARTPSLRTRWFTCGAFLGISSWTGCYPEPWEGPR